MANFKVGQRVVYVGTETDPVFNIPQRHEIVTIHSTEAVHEGRTSYDISEYLYAKDGMEQGFSSNELKPLDHSFADSILEEIKQNQLQTI